MVGDGEGTLRPPVTCHLSQLLTNLPPQEALPLLSCNFLKACEKPSRLPSHPAQGRGKARSRGDSGWEWRWECGAKKQRGVSFCSAVPGLPLALTLLFWIEAPHVFPVLGHRPETPSKGQVRTVDGSQLAQLNFLRGPPGLSLPPSKAAPRF